MLLYTEMNAIPLQKNREVYYTMNSGIAYNKVYFLTAVIFINKINIPKSP